jgi:cytidylate kinase
VIAPDAVHVDTTGVPVDDVVKTVMTVVEERGSRAKG